MSTVTVSPLRQRIIEDMNSPDFNPIEQFFAKLKFILREIAAYTLKGIAFTVDRLCKAIVSCLDQIARAECPVYLANSGYGQPKRETL